MWKCCAKYVTNVLCFSFSGSQTRKRSRYEDKIPSCRFLYGPSTVRGELSAGYRLQRAYYRGVGAKGACWHRHHLGRWRVRNSLSGSLLSEYNWIGERLVSATGFRPEPARCFHLFVSDSRTGYFDEYLGRCYLDCTLATVFTLMKLSGCVKWERSLRSIWDGYKIM